LTRSSRPVLLSARLDAPGSTTAPMALCEYPSTIPQSAAADFSAKVSKRVPIADGVTGAVIACVLAASAG